MKFSDTVGRSTGIVSTRQITGLQKKPNNQGHIARIINLDSDAESAFFLGFEGDINTGGDREAASWVNEPSRRGSLSCLFIVY